MLVFIAGGLHRGWWAWTDTRDLLKILRVNIFASVAFAVAMISTLGTSFPRSIYFIDFLICLLLTGGLRLLARITKEMSHSPSKESSRKDVLIYGAGWAGASLAREMRMNAELRCRVIGFIDDNPSLLGESVAGHRVLGSGRNLIHVTERLKRKGVLVDEVIISMPSASGRQIREAVSNCRAASLNFRTLPGIANLLQGKGLTGQVREIAVEDLLGREPIRLDKTSISAKLKGKRVLVSGAAGSIGSVLCHQIAGFEPASLVLLDQAESNLFDIDLALRDRFPELEVIPEIGDIRNPADLESILREHRIQVIYHAAAYKHVPLMEDHAISAVHNNVVGTWNLAQAAHDCGVESFVMISSDKAVNPTNVMGTTKRAAELAVAAFNNLSEGQTRFVSVRFGNVLGSSGSVVPTFRKQIAAGGPVTVTHPEVRRFFMLTEEAAQLVLQASSLGNSGEIFVLEMGELIKIADLAANMIRLAGLTPHEDIEIRYIGLRPGEKLYEEVISKGESIVPTAHERIKVYLGKSLAYDVMSVWMERLRAAIEERDEVEIVQLLKEIVPEYQLSEAWKARIAREARPSRSIQVQTQ